MTSPENMIGTGKCPVCDGNTARFTLTKSGLCCMSCNRCNCQIFARSGTSDEKLRACIAAAPAAAPPAPAPAAPAAPAAAPTAKPARTPAAKPPAPATPLPARTGFGLMGAW